MKTYNFKRTLAAAAVGAVVAGLVSAPVYAETDDKGFLQGVAKDSSGAVASGVTVTITHKGTGLTRTVVTDSGGQYKFPLLPSGEYDLVTSSSQYEEITDTFAVGLGSKTLVNLSMTAAGNKITVVGSIVKSLDVTSSESNFVFDDEEIARMPVARNLSDLAQLAPGVIKGDTAFGNLPSIGGSSVAENIYIVNGLNITSHRDGLALTTVPFEFYDTFNVMIGGWSPEYGRALGGAIVTTTKKGSNEFKGGMSAYIIDDSMRGHSKNVDSNDGSGLWLNTENDTLSESNYNFWAGGALIKDKLFAFGLLNPRVVKSTNIGNTGYSDTDRTDLFYGLKLDYYMSDEHILEFTAFGDDRDYDVDTGTINNGIQTFVGPYVREIGGNNMSIQYTGVVSDQVTISAMYGVNKFSNSSFADGAYNVPCAFERTTGQNYSGYVLCTNVNQEDEREQFRFDVDWYVGDHTLRFGIDTQTLTANESTGRSGGFVYRYDTDFYGAGDSRVRVGVYENHGSFETEDAAIYVQDTWEVTPDLTLKLGMRNDAFANYNADGEKFIDIKDQWAPRLGLAWDPTGSGEEKVYASFGKYYLGVATNTNVRLAGAELFTRTFCHTDGPDANGVPINLNTCGAPTVYGDGQQRSTGESVDATIEPMFSEETIVGYQKQYDSWIAGVKWTYRDLGESIEDIAIDAGFDAFLADQGQTCFNCSGFHYYVLTNPGSGVTTITTDPNGGTNPQTYTIPNSYLGYPKAKRTYRAWDFEVTHPWDGDYSLTLAYTWSHSEGNNEGWVRSDNGQTDAGLTTNFDQPGLTDHGYGDLPNDRRHQFKAYGTFALNDNLTTGFSFSYATGRPYGAFGVHPTDMFASWYGSSSFYMSTDTYGESIAVPRGSLGRLPDTWKLDVNLKYNTKLMGGDATIGIDIFNLLNNDEMTEINEVADYVAGYRDPANGDYSYVGMPDPNFGLPDAFQTPRTVRLSASWKF